jgi:glucose dehydrogenase
MKWNLVVPSLIAAGAIATSSLVLGAAADLESCCTPGDKDFPKVGGNLGNQAYSALTQINKANVKGLSPAWVNRVSAAAPANDDTGQQTTPIVVDGVIYLDTPNGDVIAVDGATGATKWKWHPTDFNPTGTRRGVSVGDGKVYTLASGNRVVALDKETGAQVWAVQPTGPGGASLGNTQKVATTYYEGKVYIGTNDANRNAGYAVSSSDGTILWSFYGGAAPGTVYTDVNGKVIEAGATWGEANTCALTAGVSTWIHPAIDPELGMVYWAYGNVRSCRSSQDGELRPGDNLFSDSMVALDDKTGEYKWHFQTNHHDIWDMDNTHPPVLADVMINGEMRKVIYQGSKSGMNFVYDRTNGKPVLGIEERPVTTDSRQSMSPTQPWPMQPPWIPQCVVYQQLGTEIPGDPNRAVPNYNGYQPDAAGRLVYTEPNYLEADKPFVTYPPEYGATHRKGCLRDAHYDLPISSTPSQNGGADWAGYSFSPKLGLLYIGYGTNPFGTRPAEGGNGLRAIGQYQTGGMVAIDGSTNLVRWRKEFGLDARTGDGILTTASDLLFKGLPDGNFFALDAANGKELWKFQTGFGVSAAPITYSINGEQYVAIFAAGTSIPYGNSVTYGDALWAFKLGGTYKTETGSSQAPTPAPLVIRRPVGGNAVEGSTVDNTIYLAARQQNHRYGRGA